MSEDKRTMVKTALLKCRTDESTKLKFSTLAEQLGKGSSSELLHELIDDFLSKHNVVIDANSSEKVLRNCVLSTRIHAGEMAALDAILLAERTTVSAFLLRLVRARLTKTAQFSGEELQSLRDATRQLVMLGRNFNQLLKAIHGGLVGTLTDQHLAELMTLKDGVNFQRDALQALIASNRLREMSVTDDVHEVAGAG